MSSKIDIVKLRKQERRQLEALIRKGKSGAAFERPDSAEGGLRAARRGLLALRNDPGLSSEEYDPAAKRLVGNFPQAFSHIALINFAYNLARAAKPAGQRSGAKAPEVEDDRTALF